MSENERAIARHYGKAVADAVSKLASGAAHRQVMDPCARDISDIEREGHRELQDAIAGMIDDMLDGRADHA